MALNDLESLRAQAVDAYRRTGSIRGAARLLRQTGAACPSRQFVTESLRRAGIAYGEQPWKGPAGAGGSPAGVDFSGVQRTIAERTAQHAARERADPPFDLPPQPPRRTPDVKRTETDDGKATVEYVTQRPIVTLEDAVEHAKVDLSVWRVRRWSVVAWQVGMKLRQFDDHRKVASESPHTENLWRVSMDLERILPKAWHDATEAIIERMKEYAPVYPKMRVRQPPTDPCLLEVDLSDHHFGKLAWKPETGTNYDLRIAEKTYRNAVIDLLNRAAGFEIERILLPIGNDLFHVDNPNSTTTAGTPQDMDGRYAKMIEVGTMSVIWAIETLMAIAPLDCIYVPGNHDRVTSLHLAREIAAWFRSSDQVKVDYSPTDRKYRLYGDTLLGFTHGNEEKHADLPTVMAVEQPENWALSRTREWHIGHHHRAKELRTMPLNTHQGVGIRFLMSLSGTDAWHARRAYIGSQRAAECFLWARSGGMVGHFVANVRED